jgi:hypothetical protein
MGEPRNGSSGLLSTLQAIPFNVFEKIFWKRQFDVRPLRYIARIHRDQFKQLRSEDRRSGRMSRVIA